MELSYLIMEVLKRHSSEKKLEDTHPLNQKEILDILRKDYPCFSVDITQKKVRTALEEMAEQERTLPDDCKLLHFCVEFSMDVYSKPREQKGIMMSTKDCTIEPAVEIVLYETPREIERSTDEALVFRDLKPYLQSFGYFSVVDRRDWSHEAYELRDDILGKYDDMHVYGIGMDNNPDIDERLKEWKYDTYRKKRMVIVLSDRPKEDA